MMDEEEISRLALRKADPDENDLHGPDRLLYFELREIYRAHKQDKEPIQIGQAKKIKAIRERDRFAKILAEADKAREYDAALWKRIEFAAKQYTTNPSVETADAFYFAVYQVHRSNKHQQEETTS